MIQVKILHKAESGRDTFFETRINDFLSGLSDEAVRDIQIFHVSDWHYAAMITYEVGENEG